jgi:hypothetical protein
MLEAMARVEDPMLIVSKRKAINTLLPYAIYLEQGGQQGMIDAIVRAARFSDSDFSNHGKFVWRQVVSYISRLFEKQSPASLNRVITLISPYMSWERALNSSVAVARWAAAVSTIPYTEEVGQSVVFTLFQIADISLLRPHIPIEIWGILKMQPSLPRIYNGVMAGGSSKIIAYVRRLGDIDLLKSYFLLVWTDRSGIIIGQANAMKESLQQDFGGTGMEEHRKDLIRRLDQVLGWLDQGLESHPHDMYFNNSKAHYTDLKGVLVELDKDKQ